MSATPISILYAFNNAYAQHAAASLASLIRHSTSPLDVLIVSTEDPAAFEERFQRSFDGEDRVSLRFKQLGVPADFPTRPC
ncbi:MAG: hypothetical protein M3N26_08585 [Pseudomonadota bacterium]|nr:hypothetical protein [Pseudomonadota bacterium]